jgi:hypothetical protein
MVFPLSGSKVVEALYLFGYKASERRNSQSGRAARKADIGWMHGEKSSRRDEGMKTWIM